MAITVTDTNGTIWTVEFEGHGMYFGKDGLAGRLDGLESYYSRKSGKQIYQTANLKIQFDAATYSKLVTLREDNKAAVKRAEELQGAVAEAEAIISGAPQVTTERKAIVARYPGRCARTGRFFPSGTEVERYMGKWAIVGTQWEPGAMDDEDSPF